MFMAKQDRLAAANKFLETIAGCGRKFFRHGYFVSTLELSSSGKVFFIDYYTEKRINTHKEGHWNGFTSGGSLKMLIGALRDFVITGEKLNAKYFDPEISPWGYGEDILKVKESAIALGIAE